MREIKFRARHKETGAWWYGSSSCKYIIPPINLTPLSTFWLLVEDKTLDPKTMGQYTGLKDKNGKEIYEGDIVLCPEWEDYDKGIMGQVKRTVRWDNSDACFAAFLKDEPDREGYMLDNAPNMEVIGNIWENPELLG